MRVTSAVDLMKVSDMILQLEQCDPNAEVFSAYDGNIVVTRTSGVTYIGSEEQIQPCWWRVQVGDVVIMASV